VTKTVAGMRVAPIDLGEPLRGGLTATTVDIADGGCLRDFRLVFRDGRTLIYPSIDVCHYRRLRLTGRDGRSPNRDDRSDPTLLTDRKADPAD
jgi:hypothetical protein